MNKQQLLLTAVFAAFLAAGASAAENALDYYRQQSSVQAKSRREDRAFAQTLAENTGTWLAQHPADARAKEALLLQSRLYSRAQMYPQALVSLLKIRFYHPNAADAAVLNTQVENVMNELDKDAKPYALKVLAVNTEDKQRPQREAALLEALVQIPSEDLYPAAAAEFEAFFAAHPGYAHNDKLELLYGDLHRQNGNYLAAVTQYKKVNELYAATPYKAASLRMAGDVYADNLQDAQTATSIYSSVLRQYPGSNEEGIVYKHMAIMDENNKNYESALINYDKAAELLQGQDAAYEALRGKADVYLKTKDYANAYKALLQTADAFSHNPEKYTDSMRKAAETAHKRLKDSALHISTLEKALAAYPQNAYAPEMMYDLAYSYEKAGKKAQASAMYKKLVVSYPTDSYANKAQSRLARIEK